MAFNEDKLAFDFAVASIWEQLFVHSYNDIVFYKNYIQHVPLLMSQHRLLFQEL